MSEFTALTPFDVASYCSCCDAQHDKFAADGNGFFTFLDLKARVLRQESPDDGAPGGDDGLDLSQRCP